jgi:hypothetical protein
LEICPGARNSLTYKRPAGTKKMRKPLPASDSLPAWLQPSPACTSASSSQPDWLQPKAIVARKLTSSTTGSASGAPSWLNPAPSSCS